MKWKLIELRGTFTLDWNELMKIIKWNREYSREVSDKSQCSLRNTDTAIAEILLSEKNLYYRPWHVVDL